MEIKVGMRLYHVNMSNGEEMVTKGTLTAIRKRRFSPKKKYIVTWDDGTKETFEENEVRSLIESREEKQSY